jgi:hypothetical protein
MGPIKTKKLWQLAPQAPHQGLFSGAEIFSELARNYFQWCDDNPRYKTEIIKHKMEWDTVEIELKRPYTMSGLCMHLGVSQSYFRQTKADFTERMEAGTLTHDKAHLLAVFEWVEQIVFTDQIEGAATGQYNANIIARLNGLSDNINTIAAVDPILRVTTRDQETATNLNLLIGSL